MATADRRPLHAHAPLQRAASALAAVLVLFTAVTIPTAGWRNALCVVVTLSAPSASEAPTCRLESDASQPVATAGAMASVLPAAAILTVAQATAQPLPQQSDSLPPPDRAIAPLIHPPTATMA